MKNFTERKPKDCFSIDDLISFAKSINKKYPDLWEERKPYNPPSLYKKASIWNKIVWKIKKVIKLLFK